MTVVQDGKTGFLVPRCPGFFAERLDVLLSDPTLREKMGAAARASVMEFSWQNVAQQVYAIYAELVSVGQCLVAL
jgi:D-inositol-3-phosphate glycosyltransferase